MFLKKCSKKIVCFILIIAMLISMTSISYAATQKLESKYNNTQDVTGDGKKDKVSITTYGKKAASQYENPEINKLAITVNNTTKTLTMNQGESFIFNFYILDLNKKRNDKTIFVELADDTSGVYLYMFDFYQNEIECIANIWVAQTEWLGKKHPFLNNKNQLVIGGASTGFIEGNSTAVYELKGGMYQQKETYYTSNPTNFSDKKGYKRKLKAKKQIIGYTSNQKNAKKITIKKGETVTLYADYTIFYDYESRIVDDFDIGYIAVYNASGTIIYLPYDHDNYKLVGYSEFNDYFDDFTMNVNY